MPAVSRKQISPECQAPTPRLPRLFEHIVAWCLKQSDKDQGRHHVHDESCLFRCAGAMLVRTEAVSNCRSGRVGRSSEAS